MDSHGCRCCGGSGFRAVRDADRANEIGIDRRRFSFPWRKRYEKIFGYLVVLDSQVSCCLRVNSREPDLFECVR